MAVVGNQHAILAGRLNEDLGIGFADDAPSAGGAGNGCRLAELIGATNPSGWSGVLKVKTPSGTTLGYILLHSNP